MGTNFYWKAERSETCPCCGHTPETKELHIGKSSGGWCFSLHVIPEEGINTLEDWKRRFEQQGSQIVDEYGNTLDAGHMLRIITERNWTKREQTWPSFGYHSHEHFLAMNHAEPGPNGCLRHRLGNHCVGHGEGTWDYIKGDFS